MRRVALDLGVGPFEKRWLRGADLNFSESGHVWSEFDVPVGLVTEVGWLVFHHRQLVLTVPDEVHTYWHHQLPGDPLSASSIWHISDSEWLASFDQTHLQNCRHFVVDLKDYIVEVVCEALLSGAGDFDLHSAIALHPPLADAHFWLGIEAERAGDLERAEKHFAKVAVSDGAFFQDLAREHISRLRPSR